MFVDVILGVLEWSSPFLYGASATIPLVLRQLVFFPHFLVGGSVFNGRLANEVVFVAGLAGLDPLFTRPRFAGAVSFCVVARCALARCLAVSVLR